MEDKAIIGKTKSSGFQFGVRKTFQVNLETAWEFLFSDLGLSIWLGEIKSDDLTLNQMYLTADGTKGKITTFKVYSHIRLSWKPKYLPNSSALQIRVISSNNGVVISFHHDKLIDENQREQMQQHWKVVVEKISQHI